MSMRDFTLLQLSSLLIKLPQHPIVSYTRCVHTVIHTSRKPARVGTRASGASSRIIVRLGNGSGKEGVSLQFVHDDNSLES